MTADRVFVRVVAALALFTPLMACSELLGYQDLPSYRYRLTVEVDTPEGPRSGSSVMQIDSQRGPGWTPDKYSAGRDLSGDAVTINLGRRGQLFMILCDGGGTWGEYVMLNFVREFDRGVPAQDEDRVEIEHILALRGKRRLEGQPQHFGPTTSYRYWGDGLPEFLTFTDPRRPTTARWVAPDHLDRVFGKGVTLREITVETTTDPVTRTITNALPWATDERAVSTIPDQPRDAPEKFMPPLKTTNFRGTIG
jgi:hypothetical protein